MMATSHKLLLVLMLANVVAISYWLAVRGPTSEIPGPPLNMAEIKAEFDNIYEKYNSYRFEERKEAILKVVSHVKNRTQMLQLIGSIDYNHTKDGIIYAPIKDALMYMGEPAVPALVKFVEINATPRAYDETPRTRRLGMAVEALVQIKRRNGGYSRFVQTKCGHLSADALDALSFFAIN